jgi:hypothetical protein
MAGQVVAARELLAAAMAIHQAPRLHKATMAVDQVIAPRTMVLEAAVARLPLVLLAHLPLAAMAVLAQRRQSLAVPLLMPVVVAAVMLVALAQAAAQAVAAVAAQTQRLIVTVLREPQTQAAAVGAVGLTPTCRIHLTQRVVRAALASSSSSTTSALPQSSPSSHRRSGLHQRVR